MPEHDTDAQPHWWDPATTILRERKARKDWRLQIPPEPPLLTAKAVRAVLRDVGLLLDYLNRLPETPLDRYFSPSPAVPAAGTRRLPTPPCTGQAYFLGRIAAIAALGEDAKPDAVTQPHGPPLDNPAAQAGVAGPGPGHQLTDLAFLIWCCDFLAAVASPATLDTIRVTRAYRAGRMMRNVSVSSATQAAGTADERDVFMSGYGIAIAKRVRRFQCLAMFLLWFSLYLSFMVYSGQVLMHENGVMQADRAAFEVRERDAAAQDAAMLQGAARRGSGLSASFLARAYCDQVLPVQPDGAPRTLHLAVLVGSAALLTPPPGMAQEEEPSTLRLYVSDRQLMLCQERSKLDRRERDLKEFHGRWIYLAAPVMIVTAPWVIFGSTPDKVTSLELDTHRYGMQQVINGLLAGIMPAMYAALGALASLFRRIADKAEHERLGPADFGGMMSSLVLGGLTGAVIGLFANILPHDTPTAGLPLTTTALALLAGYAADRVFTMFDSLAARVFVVTEVSEPKRS